MSSPSKQSPWAARFGSDPRLGEKAEHRDIIEIIQELDNDPQVREAAHVALDEINRKEPERKALVSRLLREIEGLSDKWDRESDEYKPEREKIIAEFRTEEAAALASAKDEQDRAIIQQEFRKKEIVLGRELEARAAKIDGILDELNAKKEEVIQYLDTMTITMLKEYNRAWRDD